MILERTLRRNPWRDATILALLCAFSYTIGLTTHGLTNWQEARRAVVGREMFTKGEWIVPTYFGEPYIAKPPMIYWVQMIIGRTREAFGATPFADESELRLTVALGGLLGVLATYFAARRLLRDRFDVRLGDEAAWLSALGLAGGVLFFRSSRIGELDVLTVPFVVTAIAAVHEALRIWVDERRTSWLAIALATIMTVGAALTKGPPAVLVVALAGYLPLGIAACRTPASEERHARNIQPLAAAAGGLGVALAAWILAAHVNFPIDWLGLAFFGLVGATVAVSIVRLADRATAREWLSSFSHTHPLLVLGLPVLSVWGWGRLVAARIGNDSVAALASAEVEDNLRILVLDSPAKNVGFMLYGIAPISLAMVAGTIWMLRERPSLVGSQRVPLVWCAAGLGAFSVFGKGVARYLTPVWPGVAMLGGLWLAYALRDAQRRLGHARLRHASVAVLLLSIIAQTWWYGLGREIYFGDRSPRAFIRELLPKASGIALTTWKLDEPALDYYALCRLPILDAESQLISRANEEGLIVVIGRSSQASEWTSAVFDAGFTIKGIALLAPYRWRADGERIGAWRISR